MKIRAKSIFLQQRNCHHSFLAQSLKHFTFALGENFANVGCVQSSKIKTEFTKYSVLQPDHPYHFCLKKIPHLKRKKIEFFGNNNLGVVVKDTKTSIVVLFTYLHHTLDLKKLSSPWFPVQYAAPIVIPVETQHNKQEEVLAFFTEYFTNSLESKVCKWHPNNKEVYLDDDHIYLHATQIGIEILNFLAHLESQQMIWTDMKPSNILLRKNDKIVISDFKGLFDVNQLSFKPQRKTHALRASFNSTDVFLSSSKDRLFGYSINEKESSSVNIMKARNYFREEWQKEYAYQLAVLFYFILTGKEKFTDDPFVFTHPCFRSENGKIFEQLIIGLSQPDLKKRLHYKEALFPLMKIRNKFAKVEISNQFAEGAKTDRSTHKTLRFFVDKIPAHKTFFKHSIPGMQL